APRPTFLALAPSTRIGAAPPIRSAVEPPKRPGARPDLALQAHALSLFCGADAGQPVCCSELAVNRPDCEFGSWLARVVPWTKAPPSDANPANACRSRPLPEFPGDGGSVISVPPVASADRMKLLEV